MKGKYIKNMNYLGEKYSFTLGYETTDENGKDGFFIKGIWFIKKDANLIEFWESQNVLNTLSKTFLRSVEGEFKRLEILDTEDYMF